MTTGETQIDYRAMAQEAMRGIVRSALRRVADLGYLPGQHHFYIAFDTHGPGVVISNRLKQKYPDEMTIVLQHQFRDLTVGNDRFEVTLYFDSLPEHLTIPLHAVRVFFDPSVPYGIQFDSSDLVREPVGDAALREADTAEAGDRQPPATAVLARRRSARKPRAARNEADDAAPVPAASEGARAVPPEGSEAAEPDAPVQRRQPSRPKVVGASPEQPINPANDAKVVQLDKFRKR
jgi:uncharacterized protein